VILPHLHEFTLLHVLSIQPKRARFRVEVDRLDVDSEVQSHFSALCGARGARFDYFAHSRRPYHITDKEYVEHVPHVLGLFKKE
jgi:hypothetical protein